MGLTGHRCHTGLPRIQRPCRIVLTGARRPASAFSRAPLASELASWTASWPGRRSVTSHAGQEEALPLASDNGSSGVASGGVVAVGDALPPPPPPSPRKRGRKPNGVVDGESNQGTAQRDKGKRGKLAGSRAADQPTRRLKWSADASLVLSRCIVNLMEWIKEQPGALGIAPKEKLAALAAAYPELKGYSMDELNRKRMNTCYRVRLVRKATEQAAADLGQSAFEPEMVNAAFARLRRVLPADFTPEVYKVLEPHLGTGPEARKFREAGLARRTRASAKMVQGAAAEQQGQLQSKAKKTRRRPAKKLTKAEPSELMAAKEEEPGRPLKVALEGVERLVGVLSEIAATLQRDAVTRGDLLQLQKEKIKTEAAAEKMTVVQRLREAGLLTEEEVREVVADIAATIMPVTKQPAVEEPVPSA